MNLNLKELIKRHMRVGAVKQQYELWELHALLRLAKKSFQDSPSLIELWSPVIVCGDIRKSIFLLLNKYLSNYRRPIDGSDANF